MTIQNYIPKIFLKMYLKANQNILVSYYIINCMFAGTLFSVGVFSHLLKFDDAIIGVISCMSKILSGFMYAFATKSSQIYIGNV